MYVLISHLIEIIQRECRPVAEQPSWPITGDLILAILLVLTARAPISCWHNLSILWFLSVFC